MKYSALLLVLVSIAIAVSAGEKPLFQYNQTAFQLTREYGKIGQTEGSEPSAATTTSSSAVKTPGKALILSAIMPGAGELYAGSPIKAAFFFALEISAWTGVAIYQADGKDKEDKFELFADNHWNKGDYWNWLEAFGSDWIPSTAQKILYPNLTDKDGNSYFYQNTIYQAIEDSNSFTHNLPFTQDQQYYEMIGKYITQFGPGWDDVTNLDDSTYVDEGFFQYANYPTSHSTYYMGLRRASNDALDMATICFEAAMLNHVFSALDAGFTVRWKNKKAQTSMNFYPGRYRDENLLMGQVTIAW
jgi:hypothetical protein